MSSSKATYAKRMVDTKFHSFSFDRSTVCYGDVLLLQFFNEQLKLKGKEREAIPRVASQMFPSLPLCIRGMRHTANTQGKKFF